MGMFCNHQSCTLQAMHTGLEGPVHSEVEKEQKLQNITVHNEVNFRKYSLEQPSHVSRPIRQSLKKRDEMLLFQFPGIKDSKLDTLS